ncbi:kinase-like domain-containing protein [Mrakia frigida]|uniref:kinase-like domain-containing protein n=1 Tax=Mrakia frigida TaxID=29902 RepID=UPI003FCC2651
MSSDPTHLAHVAFNQTFLLSSAYTEIRPLGIGAYGDVVKAKRLNEESGADEWVAVKRVKGIGGKRILTKRCLREMKLMRHLRGHPAIVNIYDSDIVYDAYGSFSEVYIYEELCATTLGAIIASNQPLGDENFSSFLHQILSGLKYIHSANVLHRDLKPENLLVNADGSLKICDFGLSRGFAMHGYEGVEMMTEYVATRWYRAPEIMLSQGNYTPAVDVWSVGCILAELLGSTPIFKGSDVVTQLDKILDVLGTPSLDSIRRICSPRTIDYLLSLPFRHPLPFQQLYPHASNDALDLLGRLLVFDPSERMTVEEALEHGYLETWHAFGEEEGCGVMFDTSFEAENTIEGMKVLIEQEVQYLRALVRNPHIPRHSRREPTTAIDFSPQTASLLSPGLPPSFSAQAGWSPSGVPVPTDEAFQTQTDYGYGYEGTEEVEVEDPGREFERRVWGD